MIVAVLFLIAGQYLLESAVGIITQLLEGKLAVSAIQLLSH